MPACWFPAADEYPMVTLTKLGEEVMKGRTDYKLRWPSRTELGSPEKGSQRKSNTPGSGNARRNRFQWTLLFMIG